MGGADNQDQALAIFTRLRAQAAGGQKNTPCNDKNIELTLGRHLELRGGADNLEQALAIYTRLRAQAAGKVDTPCDDKEIELTIARHLELMGGADNQDQALAIYTRLRARAAGGRENTPCKNKEIELSLGRNLELRGGAENLERALAIYTRLRTRAAAGKVNTPCDDKDIELCLGRIHQLKGGEQHLKQAWAIYTRLRTQAAGGKACTPCNDKEIELALAVLAIERENWPEFDALRIETRRFPGFEPDLCLSVRYYAELLGTWNIAARHLRLLAQALKYAVLAIEASGAMNASCISQLAHCLRMLSCWPGALLKECGIQHKDVRGLQAAAKFLFDIAEVIAPGRQLMEKDQRWRAKEQKLRALLSRQQAARDRQHPLTY